MELFKQTTVLLICLAGLTASMEIKSSCFDCANTNNGWNYMCLFDGKLQTNDPFAVACCNSDDSHEYCQASATNICSRSYNDAKHSFYTNCPRINSTSCGLDQAETDMRIDVGTQKQTFQLDTLRYKNADHKFKTVDICYYQVMNPLYTYISGNVYLKFTSMEKGVKLYLNAGSDVRNSTIDMQDQNRTIELEKEYKIDQSLNFIVTAIPEWNSYNTSFSFEYYTDGEIYPWYEYSFLQGQNFYKTHNKGDLLFYASIGFASVLLALFLCCCYVCFTRICCKRASQVDVFKQTEMSVRDYEMRKAQMTLGPEDLLDV